MISIYSLWYIKYIKNHIKKCYRKSGKIQFVEKMKNFDKHKQKNIQNENNQRPSLKKKPEYNLQSTIMVQKLKYFLFKSFRTLLKKRIKIHF